MSDVLPLRLIVEALDGCGIPNMLAGSFASSFHGVTRTTADIDIVIDPADDQIDCVVDALDLDRFYVDRGAARRAVAARDQFNVIDVRTGWKVDLVVRKDRAFSRSEMARRRRVEILGVDVAVATAEDTILAKLEWAALGASERQVTDVIDVLRSRSDLDDAYLDHWAAALGLTVALADARLRSRTG